MITTIIYEALPNALVPLTPEIFVGVMVCLSLLVAAFMRDRKNHFVYVLVQVALLLAMYITYQTYTSSPGVNIRLLSLHNAFVLDKLAFLLKEVVYITAFISFLYSRQYNEARNIPNNEFYILGLLSVLGMMVLISGHNLLVLFLGLELMSLPIYAMVALRRERGICVEAAMKYFVIGALASGMLLYGMSMVFGATRSIDISQIASALVTGHDNYDMLVLGLVFMLAGVCFKLGAAPFHMWVPDVYDGAPTSVTSFLSTAPKLAAFALAIRIFVQALPALSTQWQEMLIVVSILSMAIGNFAAIVQTNIKRMLAYSSIAHMGYALLGIACATQRGEAAALFYFIVYTVMTLGAFGIILLLSSAGVEVQDLKDFAGLSSRQPWFAFLMLLIMFSMAGVPPIVGFIAKVGVLEALIQAHFVWLVVLALVFAIIGAYYYLRVVKIMYFEESASYDKISCTTESKIIMSLNGVAVLFLGVFPGFLFALCHSAM